jgi:hypothetical protein
MEISHQLHYRQLQQEVDIHLIDGGRLEIDEKRGETHEIHIYQHRVKHFTRDGYDINYEPHPHFHDAVEEI